LWDQLALPARGQARKAHVGGLREDRDGVRSPSQTAASTMLSVSDLGRYASDGELESPGLAQRSACTAGERRDDVVLATGSYSVPQLREPPTLLAT
jgi:hypothetical protein